MGNRRNKQMSNRYNNGGVHSNHGGHAKGHVREMFREAIEAWTEWNEDSEPMPTVDFEDREITVYDACGLL